MDFLSVRDIAKHYAENRGDTVKAIANMTFECQEGEFVCLLGPTGCGKTTTLRIIAGLERPTDGSIRIDGQTFTGINPHTTMVFQQNALFPWRTVIDNIAFGMEMKGISSSKRRARALELITLIGLQGFEKARPYELSGGMQQRVALARALACDTRILLLDEPFGALDERTRHRLQEELLSIWHKNRKTILFVTHNIDEAIFLAGRILILRDRPGAVEKDMEIDLPRPRDRRADSFIRLHIHIREIIENILQPKEET